jgi:hypothetical protein
MRPLLHLVSLVLALPGIALAAALLILGHAIATHTLLGFFKALLDTAAWLLPWGLLACSIAFVMLVAGGLSARFRWLASSCVAVLAIGSSVVVLVLTSTHNGFSSGQLVFFVPAVISASVSIWLAVREWPRQNCAQ